MKILIDKWFNQRVHIGLIVYTNRMLTVYTNYSEVRKHNQLWWHKGQRFELVIRVGKIQFTYTNYSIGGEVNEQAGS
jgi:hypothetical protein